MKITLNHLAYLESKGVFINFIPEYTTNSTNLTFSIKFLNHNVQTCWYNDNHEFGNVYQTTISAIELAMWYLEDENRIKQINGTIGTPEYTKYINDIFDFYKKFKKVNAQ